VLDLTTFSYALRMRWEWLVRAEPDRMWASIPCKSKRIIQAMFHVSTTVVVGNGSKTLFWEDRWLDGSSIASRAPLLVKAVTKRARRIRLVSEALAGDRWIVDISGSLSILALREYVELWSRLQSVHLDDQVEDRFIWKWTAIL
jgi:hypothetical protein